jgi:hypothetical protein
LAQIGLHGCFGAIRASFFLLRPAATQPKSRADGACRRAPPVSPLAAPSNFEKNLLELLEVAPRQLWGRFLASCFPLELSSSRTSSCFSSERASSQAPAGPRRCSGRTRKSGPSSFCPAVPDPRAGPELLPRQTRAPRPEETVEQPRKRPPRAPRAAAARSSARKCSSICDRLETGSRPVVLRVRERNGPVRLHGYRAAALSISVWSRRCWVGLGLSAGSYQYPGR